MKHSILFSSLMLGLFLVQVACHHHDEDDTSNPVVSITSPSAGASIAGAVSIQGMVSDNDLHAMSIKVTNKADGTTLFAKEPSVHGKTEYSFSETWTPANLSAETPVTLVVEAEDHAGNKGSFTLDFSVKP